MSTTTRETNGGGTGGTIKEVLHEFTDSERTSAYYIFIYFYAVISVIHVLVNLILTVVLTKSFRNFKARSFFVLIGAIILANFLVVIVNCVCYIPVIYSWVNFETYGLTAVYKNVSYLELVADYMNLFLSCTISLQRFFVFYYPHLEGVMFRNSSRLIVFSVIILSIAIASAHVISDCFFQFSNVKVDREQRWEFICGYSNGKIYKNIKTGYFPDETISAVAYILYLIIKAAFPLVTIICYFFIFLRMYQLRNIANQSHKKEYMQLVQSFIIFIMFQISTWFSIYVFNLEMTATDAFYAKRTVTIVRITFLGAKFQVDMSAATFPVIFLLVTNKEILVAMGVRKLSNRTPNARPGGIHSRRISAVVPTASAMNVH